MSIYRNYLSGLRNTGAAILPGVVKSSSEIEAKREAARSERRKQREERNKWISKRKTDKEQNANINALEKDVNALEGKSKSDYMATKSAIKGLSKQIKIRDAAVEAQIEGIENGIKAEQAAAARVAGKLRESLVAAGGTEVEMMLTKALSDGRLTMAELTKFAAAGMQFTAGSVQALKDEIAVNEGMIEENAGAIDALEMVTTGIDVNARNLSGLSRTLVGSGLIDSGDQLDNLAHGSLFFRGRRLAIDALMFPLVLLKGSTIYAKFDREDEDFGDWLMSDVDPTKVVTGHRVTFAETATVADSDGKGFAYNATADAFELVNPTNGSWPVGTLVEVKHELGSAPNFNSILKVLGAYGITTFDTWYTSLVPLFSGKIGSLLGLGDEADFVNSKAN